MTDFMENLEDQIEEVIEEGADPLVVAAAMMLTMGQFLAGYVSVDEALHDMQVVLRETAPVLVEWSADTGTFH